MWSNPWHNAKGVAFVNVGATTLQHVILVIMSPFSTWSSFCLTEIGWSSHLFCECRRSCSVRALSSGTLVEAHCGQQLSGWGLLSSH